jgi:multidrug transporter EmrE-like cation transporter
MYLSLTLAAAIAYTVGGVFMKLSDGLSRLGPTLAVYLLFAGGASLQCIVMRRAEMGVAYVFVLGLEAVLAFLLGVWWFGESRSVAKLCGVVLIAAGIVLLHTGDSPR